MSAVFLKVLNMSITAGYLILAVILTRLIFQKAPKWIPCLLWGLVAIRLICPFSFESVLSLIPSSETIPVNIAGQHTPAITSGISIVNQVVNPVIAESFTPASSDRANPLQFLIFALAMIWIAGMVIMLAYAWLSCRKLKKTVAVCVPVEEGLLACDDIKAPFILGVFRPIIYVPSSMSGKTLENIIRHEKAHLLRHDHWWKPFGFLLLSVYWFHPLCWIAYILFCRDIEMACDEKVIRDMDKDDMAAYSQALLDCSFPRRRIAACPLAFGEVGVKERVKGVLHYKKPSFWIVLAAILICIVLAICLLTNPKSSDAASTSAAASSEGDGYGAPEEVAAEKSFYLTIGTDGVKSIEITTPYTSGGCENADGSLFRNGEQIRLEHLDGLKDLRGVTFTALDEYGTILWTASIPDTEENQGFTRLTQDGWTVTKLGK